MSISPLKNGAKGDGSTDDHVALQATIDKAYASTQWVDGGYKTYAISQPLVLRPSSRVRALRLNALPNYGPADPNNAMLMTSQGVKVAFTSAAGVITTPTAHGIPEDDVTVAFKGTLPSPLVAGRLYYARERTATTFKVSEQKSGAALDVTTGSGTVYCEVLSLQKVYLDNVHLDGQLRPGVNGLFASLQQQTLIVNLRIDRCAVGYRLDGQQAVHHNVELIECKKALVLPGSSFMWFFGTNIESSDTAIEVGNVLSCAFWGLHFEHNGLHVHFPAESSARGVIFDTLHADVTGHILCESAATSYEIRNFAPYGGDGPEPVVVDTARGYTITASEWGGADWWESSFVQARGQRPPLMRVRDAA